MESDLSQYEIRPNAIIKSDIEIVFNSSSEPELLTTASSLGPSPGGAMATPTPMCIAGNQVMSNYISSSNSDLPNQYNIIIAGEDDEDEDETCNQQLALPTNPAGNFPPLAGISQTSPYRSYTVQFKLNVLDWYYKNGQNKNLAAKMFSVDRKRIRDWLLDETNLRSDPTPERTKRKRTNCLPQYREIETALYQYYTEQREKGIRPKNADLRSRSLQFASQFGYGSSFKASVHWLCNWKRRNKILGSIEHSNDGEDEDATLNVIEEQLSQLSESLKGDTLGSTSEGVCGVGVARSVASGINDSSRVGSHVSGMARDSAGGSYDVSGVGGHASGIGMVRSIAGGSNDAGRVGGRASGMARSGSNDAGRGSGHVSSMARSVAGGGNNTSRVGSHVSGTSMARGVAAGSNDISRMGVQSEREKSHSKEDHIDISVHATPASRPSMASQPVTIDHATCEQWVDLAEQTLLALETDTARKITQLRLLLQQIKQSLHPQPVTMTSSPDIRPLPAPTPHVSTPHNTTPQAQHLTAPILQHSHAGSAAKESHTLALHTSSMSHNVVTSHSPHTFAPRPYNATHPHSLHGSSNFSRTQSNKQ